MTGSSTFLDRLRATYRPLHKIKEAGEFGVGAPTPELGTGLGIADHPVHVDDADLPAAGQGITRERKLAASATAPGSLMCALIFSADVTFCVLYCALDFATAFATSAFFAFAQPSLYAGPPIKNATPDLGDR